MYVDKTKELSQGKYFSHPEDLSVWAEIPKLKGTGYKIWNLSHFLSKSKRKYILWEILGDSMLFLELLSSFSKIIEKYSEKVYNLKDFEKDKDMSTHTNWVK